MGWKYAALLLVVLVNDIQAYCSCYESGNYTSRSVAISNSYETDDFSACYNNTGCSYIAYSGDDSYGWTGLSINWGPATGVGGKIQIFDGTDDKGTPLIEVNEGENVNGSTTKGSYKSSTSRILIKYTTTKDGAPNTYYGSMKAVPGLQPTTTTTTTVMPTTRTFNSPDLTKDPYLITHDIFIVVNQRTSGGVKALINLNGIVYNFVKLLSVTNDPNSVSQSRLSLATLTPYDPYYSIRGGIWELYPDDVISNLPNSGVTIEGNIDQALIGLVNLAFKVNTNSTTDSRRMVQRSVMLLTAEWPSNAMLSDNVKDAFDTNGVNLVVVGFGLTSDETSSLLRSENRWYNALNITDSKQVATYRTVVNPFYFNDGSATNYWCPPHPITNSSDYKSVWFQEPYNYDGPYRPTDTWTDPFDGQTLRYCNFADNQYVYDLPSGAIGMTVQVFFELEAGKDFLNFYDMSGNLVASFTGYEITGSTFYTTTTTLRARFTSDNQSVYRGFYVSITPKYL